MFERFTDDARAVVIEARAHAVRRGHPHVGTEHLLLALATTDNSVAGLLAERGVDCGAIGREREASLGQLGQVPDGRDRQALAALGIDLDEVRRAADEAFGPGALERARSCRRQRGWWRRSRRSNAPAAFCGPHFTPRSKKVLELSLREALRLKSRSIRCEHIALGLLREGQGLGCLILARLGVDADGLRSDLESLVRTRAA